MILSKVPTKRKLADESESPVKRVHLSQFDDLIDSAAEVCATNSWILSFNIQVTVAEDLSTLRKLFGLLDRALKRNQELRGKFPDEPLKYSLLVLLCIYIEQVYGFRDGSTGGY